MQYSATIIFEHDSPKAQSDKSARDIALHCFYARVEEWNNNHIKNVVLQDLKIKAKDGYYVAPSSGYFSVHENRPV